MDRTSSMSPHIGTEGCTNGSDDPCGSPCSPPCGSLSLERGCYFTGKLMTARDFQDEQTYFLDRLRFQNRVHHGFGVVCGLEVEHHPDPDCRECWVIVHPGVAIDCCGREVVLREQQVIKLPLEGCIDEGDPYELPFLLGIEYTEVSAEPVPTLYAPGDCDPHKLQPSRIRECYRLVFKRLADVDPDCWLTTGGDMGSPCGLDCECGDSPTGFGGSCLEPNCPCGGVVPLALFTDDPEKGQYFGIDTAGRRRLPVPADQLTHIAGINWPHGGVLTLDELKDMNGRLEVRFDGEIQRSDDEGTGVNEFTFEVQYGGVTQGREYMQWQQDDGGVYKPKLESSCLAVFTIDEDLYKRNPSLAENNVFVTMYCNFILDCNDNPVDGAHLRGRLPTGSVGRGEPGRVFRSWFRVVRDAPEPTMSVSLGGQAKGVRGKKTPLVATVRNLGSIALGEVTLTHCEDEDAVLHTFPDVPVGMPPAEHAFDFQIPADATNPFVICVTGTAEDNEDKDSDRHVICLKGEPDTLTATIALDKSGSPVDDESTFNISVTNNGPNALTDASLAVEYSGSGGEVSVKTSTPPPEVGEPERKRIEWEWESIDPGQTIDIVLTLAVDDTKWLGGWLRARMNVAATAWNDQRLTVSAERPAYLPKS